MGLLITIAEPDLSVLAEQVSAVMDGTMLIGFVGVGVGAFLLIAVIKGSSKNLLSFRRADIKSADCTNFSQAYCRMSRKICAI